MMNGRRGWRARTTARIATAIKVAMAPAMAVAAVALATLPAHLDAQEVRVRTTAPEPAAGGWIGFSAQMLPHAAAGSGGSGGASSSGAANAPVRIVVSEVIEGSPAARAGLRKGDRIVSVNGRAATPAELDRLVRRIAPGDTLALGIDREGWTRTFAVQASRPPASHFIYLPRDVITRIDSTMRRLDSLQVHLRALAVRTEPRAGGDTVFVARIRSGAPEAEVVRARGKLAELIELTAAEQATPFRVRVGEAPAPDEPPRAVVVGQAQARQSAPEPAGRPLLPYITGRNRLAGAELTPLNPELGAYFGVGSGLLVTDVTEGTPAADAGIRGGDVVVRVGELDVGDLETARAALAAHQHGPLTFTLVRERRRLTVTLGG